MAAIYQGYVQVVCRELWAFKSEFGGQLSK